MKKKMQKTLETTRFSGCPIVAVAAKPGGPEVSKCNKIVHKDQIWKETITGSCIR